MSGGLSDKKAVLLGPQHKEGEQSRGTQAVQASHTACGQAPCRRGKVGAQEGGRVVNPNARGSVDFQLRSDTISFLVSEISFNCCVVKSRWCYFPQ